MTAKYPRLEINLDKLEENVKTVVDTCRKENVSVAGVIKGTNGLSPCIEAFARGGVSQIASSRMEQLKTAKELNLGLPLMMIRIPMISEAEEVVEVADISLNSEIETIEQLNYYAKKMNKIHKVVLMVDLGDLREGFWNKDELFTCVNLMEKEFENLRLIGIGTNLGCYGSILPTYEKLEELANLAEEVEEIIKRPLEIVSGGATSSYMRVLDKKLPKKINHLRIGEGILLARDLDVFYGYDMSNMHQDVYRILGEVVEVKEKPTYPQGTMGVDAFGRKPVYEDRGIRRRAIVALGKVDVGDFEDIYPLDNRIKILGGSSDHTLLDVQDVEPLQIGDIIPFAVNYGSMVYVTNSKNIKLSFVGNK